MSTAALEVEDAKDPRDAPPDDPELERAKDEVKREFGHVTLDKLTLTRLARKKLGRTP
jgi:hypothetical protein